MSGSTNHGPNTLIQSGKKQGLQSVSGIYNRAYSGSVWMAPSDRLCITGFEFLSRNTRLWLTERFFVLEWDVLLSMLLPGWTVHARTHLQNKSARSSSTSQHGVQTRVSIKVREESARVRGHIVTCVTPAMNLWPESESESIQLLNFTTQDPCIKKASMSTPYIAIYHTSKANNSCSLGQISIQALSTTCECLQSVYY